MKTLVLFACILFLTESHGKVINHIVARVNKTPITFYDVIVRYEFSSIRENQPKTKKFTRNQVLKHLRRIMIEELILQEAEKFQFQSISDKKKKNMLAAVKTRISKSRKLQKRFNAFIKKYDLNEEDLSEIISREFRYEKFIEHKAQLSAISISNSEIRSFYESNRKKFPGQKFSKVKNNIKNYLKRSRINSDITDWINQLKEKNLVEIYRE